MPHISRHKVSGKVLATLEKELFSFLQDSGSKRKKIFREILTHTERLMLTKRLALILLIGRGLPTHDISERLRMSPSTVARFGHAYERGDFTHTRSWMQRGGKIKRALELVGDLLMLPAQVQTKSLGRFIDETL